MRISVLNSMLVIAKGTEVKKYKVPSGYFSRKGTLYKNMREKANFQAKSMTLDGEKLVMVEHFSTDTRGTHLNVNIDQSISNDKVFIRGDFGVLKVSVQELKETALETGGTYQSNLFSVSIQKKIQAELNKTICANKKASLRAKEVKEFQGKVLYSAFCGAKWVLDRHNLLYSPNLLKFSKSKAGGVKFIVKRGYQEISNMSERIDPIKGGSSSGLHVGYFTCPHELILWLFEDCKYNKNTRTIYTKKVGAIIGAGGRTIKALQEVVGFRLKVVKV